MNYFAYSSNGHSVGRVIEVYEVVQSLKAYAISIYKGLWEEALNKSFFHILDHYDECSENDLTHYATRVVGTIMLNKYSKEYENEVALTKALDSKSLEDVNTNPLEVLVSNEDELDRAKISSDVDECVKYLLPAFIEDYKFFKTRKVNMRTLSYDGLFAKFSEGTVLSAMGILSDKYGKFMDELLEKSKECNFRSFSEDHYKKYIDTSVEVDSTINGVMLYKKKTSRISKRFFKFNIQNFIGGLFQLFYDNGLYSRKIGGYTAYCSLSGAFFSDKERLSKCLEREVIGRVLARSPVKVVEYERGNYIILSACKDIDTLSVVIFGVCIELKLTQLFAKCINK